MNVFDNNKRNTNANVVTINAFYTYISSTIFKQYMHQQYRMLLKPGYKLQSIIFNRSIFSKNAVEKWLTNHQYKSNKIDIAPHYYRARQMNPDYLIKQGYTEFRTLTIDPKNDIKIIIGYKPSYMRKL